MVSDVFSNSYVTLDQELLKLLRINSFLLDQHSRKLIENRAVIHQNLGGTLVGDVNKFGDFLVDRGGSFLREVSELVDVAYKRATKVLVDNRSVLDELAGLLIEQETVDAEELQELLIKRDVRVAEYV